MTLEYDGARYAGWQRQENALTIQQEVEDALYKVAGQRIAVHASGRTDRAVHALGQVAHFDTELRMAPDKFAYALNVFLPRDIRVLESRWASDDFHARFDAKGKLYRYCIHNAPHASAIHRNTRLHIYRSLDLSAMGEAAAMVVGIHDFAAFCAAGSQVRSTVRSISRSEWRRAGVLIEYEIAGSGFLYNMVRILVGTMLEIGLGRRSVESMREALSGRERALAGPTAPPHGLALVQVFYGDNVGETLRNT